MEDNNYLQKCGDDDVLDFGDVTFRVSKFEIATAVPAVKRYSIALGKGEAFRYFIFADYQ